jgi:hypothetical protein
MVAEKSTQAAGRGAQRERNPANLAASESVVREFLESAQAAGRGVKRMRNSADFAAPGESVVREFLQRIDTLARIASSRAPDFESRGKHG